MGKGAGDTIVHLGAAMLKGLTMTLRWTGYCVIGMLTLLGAASMLRAF
jgi:hypothetical protein